MRRLLLAAVLAFAAPGGLVSAQPARPPEMAAAPHPKRVLIVLDAKAFDPAAVLPQPPALGSEAQAADLAELHKIEKSRTPERLAQAVQDGEHEDVFIFSAALGKGFDLNALPATKQMLETVANDQSIMANIAKAYFKRPRPWATDTSLVGCEAPSKNPLTSYPSGHATLGYSLAGMLEALMPEKTAVIRARADDYAYSRLVCLVHYRSDVEGSRALGGWVAAQMLKSPAFQPQLAAARAELKAAGLTH